MSIGHIILQISFQYNNNLATSQQLPRATTIAIIGKNFHISALSITVAGIYHVYT